MVDEKDARAQHIAGLHSVQISTWQSVLKDPAIDAIAIATPAGSHCAMAIEALNAGKHVFVEKPLALSLEDGERMVRAAKGVGKRLITGHIFQYHPAFIKIKTLLREGKIGRLRHIHSSRLSFGRFRGESALWSLAPHDVSMILSLVHGELPSHVTAVESCYLDPLVGDAVTAHLMFASGVGAQINISRMYPERERKLVVIGDKGSLVFDDAKDWPQKLVLSQHDIALTSDEPAVSTGCAETVSLTTAQPLAEECRDFVNCIQLGRESPTDVSESLAVLSVLEAMHKAAAQKKEVSATAPLSIPADTSCNIHETAVVDKGAEVMGGTRIWHFSHILSGARIGRDCNIGQSVMVGRNVQVGDRCKIQNNVSIYEAVTLEDGVFCGPSCVFTNVLTPRAEIERKSEFLPTTVRRGATIGANATIICGVEIGPYAMVGAGAVVTRSVAAYSLVVGNPARHIGWVGKAGERLGPDMICPRTGERYLLADGQVKPVESNGETSSEPTPMIDLKTQSQRIQTDLDRRMGNVVSRCNFIDGPEVQELEQKLSSYTGSLHVIGCASGTDAITLALLALGLRAGDAVLVPAFTFVASVEPVALLGAIPIFVDIEPDYFTIDASIIEAGVRKAAEAGHRAVGIIAVDLFGHPADYPALKVQAAKHNLWILSDAAQSFGGSIAGEKVGNLATVTTTSFFPSKPLGCYGDGGAVFTNDPALAQAIRSLQRHGRGDEKFDSVRVGINSRLDTLQAAVLLAKLEVFADEMNSRQQVVDTYRKFMVGTAVNTPVTREGCISAWASYTVRCDNAQRDAMQQRLRDQGVSTLVYYPKPVHTMAPYNAFPVANGSCPVADRAANEVLSLPMHPYLRAEIQERISRIIRATD